MAFGSVNTPGAGYLSLFARVASLESALTGLEKLNGWTDPTPNITAQVGQVYLNSATGQEWVCTTVAEDGATSWEKRKVEVIQLFVVATAAPERTDVLWIDTTPDTGGLKYHDGSAWVNVPTSTV